MSNYSYRNSPEDWDDSPDIEDDDRHGYMCAIDYTCELGLSGGACNIYDNLEDVSCRHSHGAVKVKVIAVDWWE